ncbi:hypothetical protein AAVH_15932 [Aphelenchoides avenae]|nr:hypothetical protein AAVH_15932 [Aphelenchus avenae]
MSSTTRVRSSHRKKQPVQRYDPADGPAKPKPAQRPLPLRKALARKKAQESGSVMEDIRAASIPVTHYEELEAKFPESFYAGDEGEVPCYEPTMEELEDPEKLIKKAVALAVDKDTAFTKVRMPTEWVQKLRRMTNYPYFKPLMLNAVREKIRVFDADGDPGAFVRETEFYDSYLPREFNFPEEIGNVPKKIRPKKIIRNGFDPALESWLDCNKNFWEEIPTTHNNSVLYAPEVDGSLFPKCFTPFNMNGMIGFLDEAFKSQGHISGIFTNVVYSGQARSSFPWHTEDFELLSANFHHLGAPKIWFGIAPSQRKLAYETFRGLYPLYFDHCPQEPRHKRLFTLPSVLEKAGLNVVKTVQRAGDLIITRSWGYHLGISLGLNVTEAVNAGYEDLNKALIEKIHKKEMYCRCAYNVTGVILDYHIYGVNGHVNSIVKLWEEIANLRTRNEELERLLRGIQQPVVTDGLAPSTSATAATVERTERRSRPKTTSTHSALTPTMTATKPHQVVHEVCEPHRCLDTQTGLEPHDGGSRFKTRRVIPFSDDEDDSGLATPANDFESTPDPGTDASMDHDGLVPSTASTANASGNERRPKGGGRGFTQDESAAVEEQLIKDGLYDASTGRFSRRYWSLKSHLRPSGRGYWLPLAKKGPFAKRNENNLRKYFSKHYGHLL